MSPESAHAIVSWQADDREITLAVTGYQFPGNADPYDCEWLVIAGEMRCPEGSWRFSDPAFMATELPWLAAFFERGYDADMVASTDTIEPVVTFEWAAPHRVRVTFRFAAAPPWDYSASEALANASWGYPLDFDVPRDVAMETATALRAAARDFPPQK